MQLVYLSVRIIQFYNNFTMHHPCAGQRKTLKERWEEKFIPNQITRSPTQPLVKYRVMPLGNEPLQHPSKGLSDTVDNEPSTTQPQQLIKRCDKSRQFAPHCVRLRSGHCS